ncbi:MAG: hypothetical protein ABEJ28_09960 [Salinigranum sp.]
MSDPLDALLTTLSKPRRRRTLSILAERDGETHERDLAVRVAAVESGTSPTAVSDAEARAVLVDLRHVHLPKLESGALVVRDTDRRTVTVTDVVFEREALTEALRAPESVTATQERVYAALADRRRRTVLAALTGMDGPVSPEELAEEAVARASDAPEAVAGLSSVDTALVSLSHVDLPKLAEAGLVEYDAERRTVARPGDPAYCDEWTTDRSVEPTTG